MFSARAMHFLAIVALVFSLSCSSTNRVGMPVATNTAGAAPAGAVPSSAHVVIVMEENHSYGSVIGNPAMPYFNGLASQNGLATAFYANSHPSIGNYFMLTTGQLISTDDAFNGTVSADNIFRELIAAGKSWKSYAESLPGVGYTGEDVYPYVKHHNPAAFMSDVVGTSQAANLVPFTQFSADLASGQLPTFSLVVPNETNNAHDCPGGGENCSDPARLATADNWLQTNIAPVLSNPAFQPDGILIIAFDESVSTDTAMGGGHVAVVVVSPRSRPGFRSTRQYQFENVLRTASDALGLINRPGAAANAAQMSDFFGQ